MTQTLLITGATGGLAQAVFRSCAESGWRIALAARNISKFSNIHEDSPHILIEADVSNEKGASEAIVQCTEKTGRNPDALVNCAGSVMVKPMHLTSSADYRKCLSSNVDTAFFMLRAFVIACLENRQAGSAVLVSSVAAKIGIANHEAISVGKAAIEGLVRSSAATYSRNGLRINAVAPGLMKTPATDRFFSTESAINQLSAQYPTGKYSQPEDVASCINWLLSNEGRSVNGQVIPIDGGFTSVRPYVQLPKRQLSNAETGVTRTAGVNHA